MQRAGPVKTFPRRRLWEAFGGWPGALAALALGVSWLTYDAAEDRARAQQADQVIALNILDVPADSAESAVIQNYSRLPVNYVNVAVDLAYHQPTLRGSKSLFFVGQLGSCEQVTIEPVFAAAVERLGVNDLEAGQQFFFSFTDAAGNRWIRQDFNAPRRESWFNRIGPEFDPVETEVGSAATSNLELQRSPISDCVPA